MASRLCSAALLSPGRRTGARHRGPIELGSNDPSFPFGAGGQAPPSPGQASGEITLAGKTYFVDYFGSGMVNGPEVNILPIGNVNTATSFTVSSGTITTMLITPSSPSTTIVLPATMQASFSACVTDFRA